MAQINGFSAECIAGFGCLDGHIDGFVVDQPMFPYVLDNYSENWRIGTGKKYELLEQMWQTQYSYLALFQG
jgi:hypothetical protein